MQVTRATRRLLQLRKPNVGDVASIDYEPGDATYAITLESHFSRCCGQCEAHVRGVAGGQRNRRQVPSLQRDAADRPREDHPPDVELLTKKGTGKVPGVMRERGCCRFTETRGRGGCNRRRRRSESIAQVHIHDAIRQRVWLGRSVVAQDCHRHARRRQCPELGAISAGSPTVSHNRKRRPRHFEAAHRSATDRPHDRADDSTHVGRTPGSAAGTSQRPASANGFRRSWSAPCGHSTRGDPSAHAFCRWERVRSPVDMTCALFAMGSRETTAACTARLRVDEVDRPFGNRVGCAITSTRGCCAS